MMKNQDTLLARLSALNHVVLHLMALHASEEDNPLEAIGTLQMRMLMAGEVRLRRARTKEQREHLSQMIAQLNAFYSELFRYFEMEAIIDGLE